MDDHLHFSRDDLLTPDEVATILRVRRSTAIEYMRRGVIPAHKIGRRWYSAKPQLDTHVSRLFESEARFRS